MLPLQMTYGAATWTYTYQPSGLIVQPAEGPAWQFVYESNGGYIASITTPQGGQITYHYDWRTFSNGDPEHTTTSIYVLVERVANSGSVSGTWKFEYRISGPNGEAAGAIVELPSGQKIDHSYAPISDGWVLAGGWHLFGRSVTDVDGVTEIEREQRDYIQSLKAARQDRVWYVPEVRFRTITRAGRQYTTEYMYNTADNVNFADFHRPQQIVETGAMGELSRTTALGYRHLTGQLASAYVVGLNASEVTNVGGQTASRSWTYNDLTGFRETETVAGITTTFAPDARGNVATVTKANGKNTSFAYSYGQVSQTTTPGVVTTRVINPDGTVQSETTANRTTSYQHDALGRVTKVSPPGANPIVTDYAGNTIVTARGGSVTTTTLDGFGRAIETVTDGVRTRTVYDAEGRTTFQSLPSTGAADVGTGFTYDGLGRVKTEDPPGAGSRTYTYTGNTIFVLDEEDRTTELRRQAFGHPDDVRLASVRDADQKEWTYSYDAAGHLTQVAGPEGTGIRTWVYNDGNNDGVPDVADNLLDRESHPESGTTKYSYDAAGVLIQRTDAKIVALTYTHDGNDRVTSISGGGQTTTITYESGSDNRQSICVTESGPCDPTNDTARYTAFGYDGITGRMTSRTDTIDRKTFLTEYHYNGNDNIDRITYPSLRQVDYEYVANRISNVKNANSKAPYALGFGYDPSGAISTYTAGNALVTAIGFDAHQWVSSIGVGGLQLGYEYDKVGNIKQITDGRPGMLQTFTYDTLDRLKTATSTGNFFMQFDYDAHGNRKSVPNVSSYTYDPVNPFRLTSVSNGPTAMTYDLNGNVESATGIPTMAYTPNNMLKTFTSSGSPQVNFAYDADDWRVKKTVGSGVPTYFLRGPNGQLLTEWQNTTPTATVKDYVYAGSRVIAVHTSTTLAPK
jgi:YD repeat-containing protein